MKRLILVLSVFFLLATPGIALAQAPVPPPIPPTHIVLNNPTVIPRNLDELYNLVENGGPGWDKFTDCATVTLTKPYFQWSAVKAIRAHSIDDHGASLLIIPAADLAQIVSPGGIFFSTHGTLTITENALFGALIQQVLKGQILLCKQNLVGSPTGNLTIYGPGAQALFNGLVAFVK